MKLVVATPSSVVVDVEDIVHVRAEDETGLFGIRPGHADFLTVLAISVLSYRGADGIEKYVALRGGVLVVCGGKLIEVATREAVAGDDLAVLEREVVTRLRSEVEAEVSARTRAARLQIAALRRMYGYLRGNGGRIRLGGTEGEEGVDGQA